MMICKIGYRASRKVMNRKLQWMRGYFFSEKNSSNTKCNTMCLTWQKKFFWRKIIIKHEQNVLKSSLNVKIRWIEKAILRKPKRQNFFFKTSCAITCIECKKRPFLRRNKKHLVINMWRMPKTIFSRKSYTTHQSNPLIPLASWFT